MKNMLVIGSAFLIASLSFGMKDGSKMKVISKADYREAQSTVGKFRKHNEIQKFFNDSYGYIVFPTVGEGAAVIGVAAGKGLVFKKGSVVAISHLSQVSVGLQLGGHSFREIVFFQDEAAFRKLEEGKIELSGKASAVAAEEGGAKDTVYNDNGVAVFTKDQKGLIVSLSLAGQKLSYEPARRK